MRLFLLGKRWKKATHAHTHTNADQQNKSKHKKIHISLKKKPNWSRESAKVRPIPHKASLLEMRVDYNFINELERVQKSRADPKTTQVHLPQVLTLRPAQSGGNQGGCWHTALGKVRHCHHQKHSPSPTLPLVIHPTAGRGSDVMEEGCIVEARWPHRLNKTS